MASDCTVALDDGYINLRVGAIIRKGGKFLMVGNQKDAFLYSVGGRIQFGETAREAVIREVFEETGVKLEVDRLGFTHENYFYGDYGPKKGKLIYEISFYFYMKTPEDFEPRCASFTDDGSQERLVWVDENSEIPYYPTFFRQELACPSDTPKHFVTDDRVSE